MNRALLTCVVFFAVAGCSRGETSQDVLNVDNGRPPVAKTTNCTVPNADGVRCDVKTCKADAASDCGIFQDRCTQSGHQYSGDKNSGTCTRGDGTARNDRDRRIFELA